MSIKLKTNQGHIAIAQDVIATIVGTAVIDNYGVVGMASKNHLKDNWNDILKKENYAKGIVVTQQENQLMIDVYIFVNYGTKISEICKNVQSRVVYELKTLLDINVDAVNVYVQGVRIVQD